MALGLIGKKIGMSQIFTAEGRREAVTVVEAGPCLILDIQTRERNGYQALKLAFEEVAPRKLSKSVAGEYASKKQAPRRRVREFTVEKMDGFEVGQTLGVDIFADGEEIKVLGTSKGKGFQGGMKRHGFSGGPAAHGSKFHRELGSTGMHTQPRKVGKGRRMPGHMGSNQVTVPRAKVLQVLKDQNVVLLKGSVPGPNGGYLMLVKK